MNPTKSSVIFTAFPVPHGRKSSPQFVELGASNLAPVEIGACKVSIFRHCQTALTVVLGFFAWICGSFITKKKVSIFASLDLQVGKIQSSYKFLFGRPTLGITITDKNEEKIAKLEAGGFSKRMNGKQAYYTGPGTPEAMELAIKLGCVTDARVPSNCINVDGLVSLTMINTILYNALWLMSNATSLPTAASSSIDMSTVKVSDSVPWFTEANLDTLPERGVFMAYFDGLLLPDRSTPLQLFIQLFSGLFGANPVAVLSTTTTLNRGWSSLNDTATGRAISHVLFCLNLAVRQGIPLTPVFLNDEYAGCVFHGKDFFVSSPTGVSIPGDKDGMKEAISRMGSHDQALGELLALVNSLPKRGETSDATLSSFTTPRAIHDKIRERKVDASNQARILGLTRKLRFRQTFWDARNPAHVASAVNAILTGQFLDKDAPCNLVTDGLWATSPIYSTLLAFHVMCPSLRGNGSGIALRVAKDMYTKVQKPAPIDGIPIFLKNAKAALEDWEDVISSSMVWFNHKGKDKHGKLRISGVDLTIPHGTSSADSIMKALVVNIASKKRDREEDESKEPTEKQKEEARAAKKARIDAYEGILGVSSETMEVDATAFFD